MIELKHCWVVDHWPLHCLSLFDWRLLITPLVPSSFSYTHHLTVYEKHFENTHVKHTTKLISFQTQCNYSTFVDKLFKSVFKSCRVDKYASKIYLNTTINSISFCFCWSNDYRNRTWFDFKIILWKTDLSTRHDLNTDLNNLSTKVL
jgi:hypothetical protein